MDENNHKLQARVAENVTESLNTGYSLNKKELTLYKNRLYIANVPKIKLLILNEIHKTPYSGHPGYQKTITMLRKDYFWPKMKNELEEYISRCFECQQVKTKHQHPAGLLQPLPIPRWKWEILSLDFFIGLPRNQNQKDSITIVIDKMFKAYHYIPVNTTHEDSNIA